jgi:hypothetical protein
MQCLSCRADNEMLLMDVLRDQSVKEPTIEHQIYMCSVCRHVARRLVFKRIKMPITRLPVIPIPTEKLWKRYVAAPRTRANAVEKLRSRQIELKERDRWLDERGCEGPQQAGGSCGTGSSREPLRGSYTSSIASVSMSDMATALKKFPRYSVDAERTEGAPQGPAEASV